MSRGRIGLFWFAAVVTAVSASSGDTLTQVVPYGGLEGQVAQTGFFWVSASLWTEEDEGVRVWTEDLGELPLERGVGFIRLELGKNTPLPPDAEKLWLEIEMDGHPTGPRTRLHGFSTVAIDGTLGIENQFILSDSGDKDFIISWGGGNASISNQATGHISFCTGTFVDNCITRVIVRNDGRVHFLGGVDAGLPDGRGYLMTGDENGLNLVMDDNELMARDDGAISTLFLQQNGGAVFVNGAVAHASDARLKHDVVELEGGLEEVLALRPVSYLWKKGDGRRHYGLIAQEVEELSKDLILEDEEGYKGVAYMELIPVLIRALQEQEERFQKQERRIRQLEAEVGRRAAR